MNEKYQNRYRIASARAEWWDYSANAAYFITICTKGRKHFFGEIQDGKMILSPVGVLADVFWHEIRNHSKDVELDAFVVMPNHIHGILILNNPQAGSVLSDDENAVEIRHALSQPPTTPAQHRFQNQGKNSASSVIGSFKAAVTKHANRLGFPFGWQPRFHDHIVRDDEEFARIAYYIENNVINWKEDKFYQ